MNTEPTPSPLTNPQPGEPPTAPKPKPQLKRHRLHIPGLANWIVGICVLLVLIGVVLPAPCRVCVKGSQTKALAQAKQIGLALKLFAGDNDGVYPRAGLPGMPAANIRNSNEAFAMLFPTYASSESLFANKFSAYQTKTPDNRYDPAYTGKPVLTLEPGENVYSYVAGLTDAGDALAPLVVDGTDGTGHYTTDRSQRGGVWEGRKAIVIHLDNSGTLETLAGPEHSRFIPRRPGETEKEAGNQLDVRPLGPNARLLDPAIGRPSSP